MSRVLGRRSVQRGSLPLGFDEWVAAAGGLGAAPVTTWGKERTEPPDAAFGGYVSGAYRANGVVFAVILARVLLFTEARFQWQRLEAGRPGGLFGTQDLALLEQPWVNGTTGDLLARMEQDVSLAGNAYVLRRGGRLHRLRPDRVSVVLASPEVDSFGSEIVSYLWWPQGYRQGADYVTLLPEEVAHFAPIPDPEASYRGMSWLTPVVDEVTADLAATRHKRKFFDNAATPNLAVTLDKALTKQQYVEFRDEMRRKTEGVDNAYRTLYLGGGADVKVIGADLKQLDFKLTQGAGETRICAAGGVPPIIVGLSEGLQAATYSNYASARRKFGDHWARPQWRSAAGALASIFPPPPGARLWYDDRDVPFLQEDQKDAAEILSIDASAVRTLTDGGYTPESVVAAVDARDLTLLRHSGLTPVQLQPAGATPSPGGAV